MSKYMQFISAMALALCCAGCSIVDLTVDLGAEPVEPGQCRPSANYFRDVIWPQYIEATGMAHSCINASGCHRRDDGRSALRLDCDLAIPACVAPDNTDLIADNYNLVIRTLNCASPDSSSLLTKPLSSEDPHGGGDLFDDGDQPEIDFLAWFNQ